MDIAIAVATGGAALGSIGCEDGDVLYIDLENGPRRIQRRIDTLYPNKETRPDLSHLEWVPEAPQLNAGFIDELERWRKSVEKPRLVTVRYCGALASTSAPTPGWPSCALSAATSLLGLPFAPTHVGISSRASAAVSIMSRISAALDRPKARSKVACACAQRGRTFSRCLSPVRVIVTIRARRSFLSGSIDNSPSRSNGRRLCPSVARSITSNSASSFICSGPLSFRYSSVVNWFIVIPKGAKHEQ